MHRLALAVSLGLLAAAPALAFDAETKTVIDSWKPGKPLPIVDVAKLMRGAERWCYNLDDGNCAWSDIYLSVDETKARYEISNRWDENTDIAFVDEGVFKDNRFICENEFNWIPSVRAYDAQTGAALEGRDLAALKDQITEQMDFSTQHDCFDYVYKGADAAKNTVTLVQRQYVGGADGEKADDAVVTLYFDKDAASGLGWY